MDLEKHKRFKKMDISLHPHKEISQNGIGQHSLTSVHTSTAVRNSSLLQSANCPYCYGSAAGYHIDDKNNEMVFFCQFCERSWSSK